MQEPLGPDWPLSTNMHTCTVSLLHSRSHTNTHPHTLRGQETERKMNARVEVEVRGRRTRK